MSSWEKSAKMTCEECRERFTDLVENSLPPELDAELRAHLESCRDCRRLLAEFWGVVEAVRGLPTEEPAAGLRERVREAVQERATQRGAVSRLRSLRYTVAGLAAAAAAVVLVWAGMLYYGAEEEGGLELPPVRVVPERPEAGPGVEEEAAVAAAEEPPTAEEGAPAEVAVAPLAEGERPGAAGRGARVGPAETRPGEVGEPVGPEEMEAGAPARNGIPGVMEPVRRTDSGWVFGRGEEAGRADTAAEPRHFAVPAERVAAGAGAAGPTPVDIQVVPPARRVVGEVVAGTVVVKPDRDVATATVSAEGSASLEIVGADGGVIYHGPLKGGQRAELSVRMRAKRPGASQLTVRLKSPDPALNTRLVQTIIGFRQPLSTAKRMIRLKFRNTPVREALTRIAAASGMKVTLSDEVDSQRTTHDFSAGVPAKEALVTVAEAGGYQVRERNGRFVVEKR